MPTPPKPGAKVRATKSPAKAAKSIANKQAYAAKQATKTRTKTVTPATHKTPQDANGRTLADPTDLKWTELTPLVLETVLNAISLSGNVTQVCDELRINRITLLKYRNDNPDYRVRWEQAMDLAVEGWEDEVARRAFRGVARPIFQQGELVGHEQVYSDRLAEMLIRAGRKAKYAPPVQKVDSVFQGEVTTNNRSAAMSQEDLNKEIAKQAAAMGALALGRTEYLKMMGKDLEDEDQA